MPRDHAEMPFLEHLEELRWRIIWGIAAVIVGCVIGFVLVSEFNVIQILERPIRDLLPDQKLGYTSPTTPFFITFKLAFVVGVVFASPLLAYQAWSFLSPALYENERRFVIPAIIVGFLLFLCGVAMAYFMVLPLGLRFLLGFQIESLQPIIMVDEYLRFAAGMILAFGVIFEMPVVLVLLSLLGIVTPAGLAKYRRHAFVALAVLSAVLTPADPWTMMLMMGPMVLLYEASIWLIRAVGGRREPGTDITPGESGTVPG